MRFREVQLPEGVAGRLFLHSMPGRCEPLDEAFAEARNLGVTRAVRLAPLDEAERKSPSYAEAIREGSLPWTEAVCEIEDYGTPPDEEAFLAAVRETAAALRAGERVLVHCGAGVGRTGTFAICVLLALGLEQEEAQRRVNRAGSRSETPEQEALVDRIARRLAS